LFLPKVLIAFIYAIVPGNDVILNGLPRINPFLPTLIDIHYRAKSHSKSAAMQEFALSSYQQGVTGFNKAGRN
jgi:hypothetical protein